jgi:hypothetical protein
MTKIKSMKCQTCKGKYLEFLIYTTIRTQQIPDGMCIGPDQIKGIISGGVVHADFDGKVISSTDPRINVGDSIESVFEAGVTNCLAFCQRCNDERFVTVELDDGTTTDNVLEAARKAFGDLKLIDDEANEPALPAGVTMINPQSGMVKGCSDEEEPAEQTPPEETFNPDGLTLEQLAEAQDRFEKCNRSQKYTIAIAVTEEINQNSDKRDTGMAVLRKLIETTIPKERNIMTMGCEATFARSVFAMLKPIHRPELWSRLNEKPETRVILSKIPPEALRE